MILIAHRGNTNGRFESHENEPTYIDKAISEGYDVEIDIWCRDGVLWLGHDKPEYGVNIKWLQDRIDKLWIHCKNVEAIVYFNSTLVNRYNYFWHQEDTLTLTSYGYIWVYPGNQPVVKSIAVMPELADEDVSECVGVCSDYIQKYKR